MMKPNAAAPTIMLIDDDEDIRKNASLILSLEGYSVYSASNGQEALDALKSGACNPALIVSDIAMPLLDGYAFFQAVRQIQSLRLVPFIFLTAHGSRRHIRYGRELGVDDYLVKPFDPLDLLNAVRNKLNRVEEFRKQAESEFDSARRSLVQLLSHELRTPLTYITGGFELLADSIGTGSGAPQDVEVSIGLIRSGTQRLTRLAELVVRYAELVSGHARLQLKKLGDCHSVVAVVDTAQAMVQNEARARKVVMERQDVIDDHVEIYGVLELLTRAIYEVLRNAIMYSPEGSTIWISAYAEGDDIVIAIKDQGRGIKPADQPTTWEIMAQSERGKHEQQGAGMGLPVVKQTMLLHGGDASLESATGKGTTVWLRMPVYKQPS